MMACSIVPMVVSGFAFALGCFAATAGIMGIRERRRLMRAMENPFDGPLAVLHSTVKVDGKEISKAVAKQKGGK